MIAMHTDKPFLQVENLAKTFTPGAPPVFDRVHLSIDSGEFACVIGHSGRGKTTILNILAGLDEASGGNVFMDGREVRGLSLEHLVDFLVHRSKKIQGEALPDDWMPPTVTPGLSAAPPLEALHTDLINQEEKWIARQ
jgi:ABC-type transporter Mla maintaining outer membrane lipid asymmetry ATPase subunit MlaF